MEFVKFVADALGPPNQEPASMAYPAVGVANTIFPSQPSTVTAPGSAGFDLIMQFSEAFVSDQFRDSVASQSYKVKKYYTYKSAVLSARVTAEIDYIAATLSAANPGKMYVPVKFGVSLTSPKVRLSLDPDLKVSVTWELLITIGLATSTDVPSRIEVEEKLLTVGTVTTHPYIDLVTNESICQVRAELDFTYPKAKIQGELELLKELLQGFLPNYELAYAVKDVLALLQISRSADHSSDVCRRRRSSWRADSTYRYVCSAVCHRSLYTWQHVQPMCKAIHVIAAGSCHARTCDVRGRQFRLLSNRADSTCGRILPLES